MSGPDRVAALQSLLTEGRYQDVLDRYSEESPPAGEPAVALALATAATRLGRFTMGEQLATAAIEEFRRRADDDGRLRASNLLGAISYERGELERATVIWEGALELARALTDTTMVARTSNNLATTHYFAGRVGDATSGYREALLAYQRLGDRRGLAETLHNLAIIARHQGALDRASDLELEAVRHAEAVNDPVLLGLVLIGRAKTQLDLGDLDLADGVASRAAVLARRAGDELGEAEVEWVRAERRLKRSEPAAALEAALRGREIAERYRSRLLHGECAALASRALTMLDRPDEARRYHEEAHQIFTALGAVLWLQKLVS